MDTHLLLDVHSRIIKSNQIESIHSHTIEG